MGGKTIYKAPNVYDKKKMFDARAADCWSLGVMMFSMIVGSAPWTKPCKKDKCFVLMMNGKMAELLHSWKRTKFVNELIVDLLSRIFRKEKCRLNIKQIKQHKWFKSKK